ncbi:hypothetical protein [Pikeienuella sp. HZG-20]|uniref:glycosyltransferase n=1 Tax=Paludibacillus litoralis TaxID=3133267 RepID=UPI0030EEDA0A
MTTRDRARAAFRLARFVKPAGGGAGGHRSGWPWVVDRLRERQSMNGMLVDQFVEATFAPGRSIRVIKRLLGMHVWSRPWVGVFHLPPNMPEWFTPKTLEAVLREPRFIRSLPHLRGAVAFSRHTGDWLRDRLGVPVLVTKHPTEMVPDTFSWDAFEANPDKRLVQIGWYLRNYRAINQVAAPSWIRKVHLAQSKPFIDEARRRTDLHSPFRGRPDVGETEVVSWLDNEAYDDMLTRNLIFLELFEASANNAIIEAIARDTPVVVNRHPAVAEYLGADYPLFYDDLSEVEGLLEAPRIRAAHEQIRALDKGEFAVEAFIDRLDLFVRDLR